MLIVGHSFGADTALDLAADPRFNGELVNVTHVVPAAYHSEPQLPAVAATPTSVGVVQNIYDAAVLAEEAGDVLQGPWVSPVPTTEGSARIVVEGGEAVVSGGAHAVNGGSWVIEQIGGIFGGDFDIPEVETDIEFVEDTVHDLPNGGFIAEFEGGFAGAGHHQDNYIEFFEGDIDRRVEDFVADIGAAGYGTPGVTLAVDVSKPE